MCVMKPIAYAICASTCLALGCFAPAYVDRLANTAIGMVCLAALATQKDRS